jgi:predicted transcriptional regulator
MSLIEQLRVLSHNDALTQSERETIYAAIRALGGNP